MIEFMYAEDVIKAITKLATGGGGDVKISDLERDLVDQVKVSCQGDIAVLPFFPDENTHGIGWLLLQQRDDGELDAPVPNEGPIDLKEAKGIIIGFDNPRSIDVVLEALSAMQEKFDGSSRWAPLADIIEERRSQDRQWGGPDHDDGHAAGDWFGFIEKQMMKTTAPRRERFVKIAALAVAAVEAIDRGEANTYEMPRTKVLEEQAQRDILEAEQRAFEEGRMFSEEGDDLRHKNFDPKTGKPCIPWGRSTQ